MPLAEFDEDALRQTLTDIDWVERIARGHERLLDQLLGATTVIPMRMCTVLHSLDRVRKMLRQERPLLEPALVELRGRQEWGVKVFLAPDAADGPGAKTEEPSEPVGPDRGPGTCNAAAPSATGGSWRSARRSRPPIGATG